MSVGTVGPTRMRIATDLRCALERYPLRIVHWVEASPRLHWHFLSSSLLPPAGAVGVVAVRACWGGCGL